VRWPRGASQADALACTVRMVLLLFAALATTLQPLSAGAQEPSTDERPAEAQPRWSAAAGFVVSAGPEFAGASQIGVQVRPGLALRWGRLSVSSRSAFSVRDDDITARGGLRLELLNAGHWRSSLGLRWDKGRREDSDANLRGLGNVRSTLRLRLALGRSLDKGWRAGMAFTADALGRSGGVQGSLSLGRDVTLSERTGLGGTLSLNLADGRYMRSWYGVTPEQSEASGYAVYTPEAGLRDLSLAVGGRTQLDARWAVFYGASVSQLLDPAAASPWVRGRHSWGLSAGLVARLF
jgi:MipA family protein